MVRQDYYFCELNRFGDSTLEVLLYCFFDASDWAIELRAKHVLNLDIMRLAKDLGVEISPPAQVLHVAPHEARTAAAREQLAQTISVYSTPGFAGQAGHLTFTHGFEPRPVLADEVSDNSSDEGE